MLAAEVLKIWMGRFLEHNGEVEAFALTFNGHIGLDYKLLNQELSSKYFQDQEKTQVQVSHWQEFMKQFAQDHKEKLTQDQRKLLKTRTDDYEGGGEYVKSVLMMIAEVLNKRKKKVIVMIDEIVIFRACKETTTKEGKPAIEAMH